MQTSNCCGASIIENTDVCSNCKEHCEAVSEEEYYEGEEDERTIKSKVRI